MFGVGKPVRDHVVKLENERGEKGLGVTLCIHSAQSSCYYYFISMHIFTVIVHKQCFPTLFPFYF